MSRPVLQTVEVAASAHAVASFAARRRTADVVFRGALAFNAALTGFWLFVLVTKRGTAFFACQPITGVGLARVTVGILFFDVWWGFRVELCSPRGADDFVMATTNAPICLAFGMLMR